MILIFFITAIISFIGSLQLGLVNLSVINSTVQRNIKAGCWVAFGGALPELLYALLAVQAAQWLNANTQFWAGLEWGSTVFLVVVGIFTFSRPTSNLSQKTVSQDFLLAQSFLKGVLLGLSNPQLFPFWLVVFTQLQKYPTTIINDNYTKAAFVLGAGAGALCLLLLFAYLASKYLSKFSHFFELFPLNKIIGALFILLAISEIIAKI